MQPTHATVVYQSPRGTKEESADCAVCSTGVPDTPDILYSFFLGRVRDRLHVILCFSPVGAKFGRRAQQFPGLINGCIALRFPDAFQVMAHTSSACPATQLMPCEATLRKTNSADVCPAHGLMSSGENVCICRCTIDWFLPWPEEALTEVAGKFIDDFPMACPDNVGFCWPLLHQSVSFKHTKALGGQDLNYAANFSPGKLDLIVVNTLPIMMMLSLDNMQVKASMRTLMGGCHASVTSACAEYHKRYRRNVYVTPKSYLSFLDGYRKLYSEKLSETRELASSINSGLHKMSDAKEDVNRMKVGVMSCWEPVLTWCHGAQEHFGTNTLC